jgi:hypothetical protein
MYILWESALKKDNAQPSKLTGSDATSSMGSIEASRLEEVPSSLDEQACIESSLLFVQAS